MQCLIVGEDEALRQRLRRILREQGWHLSGARSAAALDAHGPALGGGEIELVLICPPSPGDEPDIAALRRALPSAIVLVLGEPSLQARAQALARGATDFIQHDASSRYLVARIAALMRLRKKGAPHLLSAGALEIDMQHRRGSVNGRELSLSQKEFDLLALLAQNCGRTMARSELIDRLWRAGAQAEDNALEGHVSRLRRKLLPESRCRIVTVRGVGYRLSAFDTQACRSG